MAILIGINILWAGSSLAAKIALGTIPPMTLAFTRFSLAAMLMYLVATRLKVDLRVARRDWTGFWAMGLLGLALTYLMEYIGIQRTSASSAALLIATEPVFLAILSWLFWRERMPLTKVSGILAGLAGVLLIVAYGAPLRKVAGGMPGNLLIIGGLLFESGASILGKRLVSRYPAVTVITYQMMTGAIGLAPFALMEQHQLFAAHHNLIPTPAALWSLLYLIIPCTVVAYTAWYTILDKQEAGEMSVFLFIQPAVGALLAVAILGDRLSTATIAGASLVLLAIGLIKRRPALPPSA